MDMQTSLKELVVLLQIKKAGSNYFFGNGKTPYSGAKLLTKVDIEITNNNAPNAILAEIDKIIILVENMKLQNKRPEFSNEYIMDILNNILDHEQLKLKFESMQYARDTGNKDKKGSPILETINPNDLRKLIRTNANIRRMNTDDKLDSNLVLDVLDYNTIKCRQKKVDELIKNVEYIEEYEGFAETFFTAMHKSCKITQDINIFIVLMKHLIWQIKRRITERSTYNDVLIAFFGAQGIGKTTAMRRIFGNVLGDFYNSAISLEQLMDDRWTIALNTQYMMCIDEFDAGKVGNLTGKEMAILKKNISSQSTTYRPLGTNDIVDIIIKSSFISTANFHFYTIINDESGMRRFFEFDMGFEKGERFDFAEIDYLNENALKLFQSIDENLEHGYWDIKDEVGLSISKIQQSYVKKTPIVEFLENFEIDINLSYKECITIDDLYIRYREYVKELFVQDRYIIQKNRFKSSIVDILGDKVVKSHSRIDRFAFKNEIRTSQFGEVTVEEVKKSVRPTYQNGKIVEPVDDSDEIW